jgi:hypothetical protein
MAGSNDFLIFAGASGANVISQATYAALAALGPGFSTGEAFSNQCNKVWRQGSEAAYVLGQLSADVTGNNSSDDGTGASLLQNVMASFLLADFHADSGAANTYQVNFSPAISSTIVDGTRVRFRPSHANTGASTLSVNGSTAEPIIDAFGNALIGGEIKLNGTVEVEWVAAATSWVLLANEGGSSVAPRVWATINGTSPGTITKQTGDGYHSFSGITNPTTGTYVLSFTNAFPDTNYSVQITSVNAAPIYGTVATKATGSVTLTFVNTSSSASAEANFDICIFR